MSQDSFVTVATYEPFGPIATVTFGNGTSQTLSWTTRYLPSENKLVATAALADYVYGEDKVGNISAITDEISAGYDRNFKYDDLNRLTTATSGASLWGTASGNGYTYDPMGDLKSIALGSARTGTFTYKSGAAGSVGLPEIKSVVENGTTRSVAYDAYGNESGDGLSTFGYSPRELLSTDSRFISAYYYDGFRHRVSTTLSAGSEHRDSFFDRRQHLLAETGQFTTGAPGIAYKYVWLGDRPVAQVDSGGTHWTFADHLGTPLAQTGTSATITWQAEYEPYGQIWAVRTGATLHQPLRLPGQSSEQFDFGNNGLTERSYNNARWYRSDWGTYTSPDLLRPRKNPDLFSYAFDNPLAWTDFFGLFPSSGGIPILLPSGPISLPISFGPSGEKQFYLHGKFCGPGYSFGVLGIPETDYPVSAYDAAKGDVADALDGCCWQHDRCHAKCAQSGQCKGAVPPCKCRCDKQLGHCVGDLSPTFATFMSISAIETFFPGDGSGGPDCIGPAPNPAAGAAP